MPIRRLSRFEALCLGVMVLGIALRLVTFQYRAIAYDAAELLEMATSFSRNGEFLIPNFDGVLEYSHHFPPLYALYLVPFLKIFGQRLLAVEVAAVVESILLVAVAFLCTRDLFGRAKAFGVAAVAATFPLLVAQDQALYSESLVTALFALTIWAVIKSVDRPSMILLAGLFAGLSYLAKASMGPFVAIAGLGGFAWRFYYVRWRVLRDVHYILAGVILLAIVGAWSSRNIARFGWPHYETQQHATDAFSYLLQQPDWPWVVAAEIAWTLAVLALFFLPWLRQARVSLRSIRDQKVSAMWLAIVTTTVIAIAFVSAFYAFEHYPGFRVPTNLRYLTAPVIPLLWVGMWGMDLETPPRPVVDDQGLARRHMIVAGVGSVVLFCVFALYPGRVVLTADRVITTYVGLGIGLALVAASTLFAWTAVERNERGVVVLRVAHDSAAGTLFLRGLAYSAVAFAAMTFGFLLSFVYAIPAAAQAFLRDPRAQVLAVAFIFAGAGLSGATERTPLVEVATVLNEHAPHGATVSDPSNSFNLPWMWPFLREDIKIQNASLPADYLIVKPPVAVPPSPPTGYHTLDVVDVAFVRAPGTWLEERIEASLGAGPTFPDGVAFVYERNVTQ